LTFPNFFVFI